MNSLQEKVRALPEKIDSKKGKYFITAIQGNKVAYLSGGYATHQEALNDKEKVWRLAIKFFKDTAFVSVGTCRLPVSDKRVGILNKLGIFTIGENDD